jgi:GPH family glycoside/pentoside/hexuronide:cation symporter
MYLLKFSTDVLLIAPAVIGMLFGLARVWDAVSDPLCGYWSDRTRTGLGRRRPWLIASALPLGLVFVGLWGPPEGLDGRALVLWMGVGLILFYTAQTALSIPHLALGAELTVGYHDRSRVFGGRMIFDFFGILLAAGALFLLESAQAPRTVATSVALAAAIVTLVLVWLTALRIRERPEYQDRPQPTPYSAYRDVLANPHARLLLGVLLLDQLGFTCLITVLPYANQYILGETGLTGPLVAGAVIAAVAVYPIWFPLSHRFGKRNPWIGASLVKSASFGMLLFLQPGNWILLFVLVVLVGGIQGAGSILGPSIQADVVDYDELETGQRKEGAYFAAWNLASKAAAGVAIAISGVALTVSGFQPNVEQSEGPLLTIRLLFAGLPLLFSALAAGLLFWFRLDERAHAEIRAALGRSRSH